jgi:hypothetical protein
MEEAAGEAHQAGRRLSFDRRIKLDSTLEGQPRRNLG